jgi:hypothetical protein
MVTWVVSRLAPETQREPLVGDLVEEYELRTNAASASAALKWYLQQVLASAPRLLWARLTRSTWISTFGVALLAYVAVGCVEWIVNWAISVSATNGFGAYHPLGMLITFPLVVVIGYFATGIRRNAAVLLGAMMLIAVTAMTVSAAESVPPWYRVAYFLVGPAATVVGSTLRRLPPNRS